MQAVVMAAGEGRRMRPLTERWAKPVLPIDGRPVIGTLLRDLAEAGIERATVVTGHLAEQVEGLVGDGSAFGLAVSYVHQPEPLGSADAVLRALQAGAGPPLVVTAADTVFPPGDVARFLIEGAGADGAIVPEHRSAPLSELARVDAALLNELMGPYEIRVLKCATDSTDLLVELSLRQFETISAALGKLKGRISKWLNEPTEVKGPTLSNGYFACTVSKSTKDVVDRYLDGQSERHGYSSRVNPPYW